MGLSLIWGVMRVINLAHGATMTLGMFCTYLLFAHLGLNPYLGMVVVVVLALIFGFLIYVVAVHRVIQRRLPVYPAGHLRGEHDHHRDRQRQSSARRPENINFSLGSMSVGSLNPARLPRLLAALGRGGDYAALFTCFSISPGRARPSGPCPITGQRRS